MIKLTIFTATYNRAHLITKLYDSLCRQSNFDFEWLVIDDGSTDSTQELFKNILSKNNKFEIRYYNQPNQGLIRSLNRGISLAQGKYFSKIDSDDFVVDNFVENILKWTADIDNLKDVYAVGGLRVTPDGLPLKGSWPNFYNEKEFVDATDLERAKYNLDADLCEAWKLEVLRQYPFPVWENEKFAPEQIVLHHIAFLGLKIRWYAVPMSICEYQDGGLTLGASKLEKENPMGYAMMYNQKLEYQKNLKDKFFSAMQCNALSFVGKNPSYIFQSNCIWISFLMIIPGFLLSIRRKNQFTAIK